MANPIDYTVRFCADEAWTIEYEDLSGRFKITFDADLDSENPQELILNPGVVRVGKM